MASQNEIDLNNTKVKGHYSGHNPIPTVKQFVQNLDRDKAERDRQIDVAAKQGKAGTAGKDVQDHVEAKPKGKAGTRKVVTDPVTGNQVEIEDVNADFMKAVDNPQVCQLQTQWRHHVLTLSSYLYLTRIWVNPPPSRRMQVRVEKNTKGNKILQHLQIQSSQVPHPMSLFMAKRRISSSTLLHPKVSSQCMRPWRQEPLF